MRKKFLWGIAPALGAAVAITGFTAGVMVNSASGSPREIQYNYVSSARTSGQASVMGGGLMTASQVHIIYVGCGAPATQPFWAVVYRGVEEAGDNLGIHWQFVYPSGSTTADLNQTTMSAIAAKPQGIALCGLDPNGQASTVAQARAAGIQVVLTPPAGSGVLYNSKLPYVGQVGQDEPVGGQVAAEQAVARWHAKSLVCTEDGTDTTQAERCNAMVAEAKTLGATGSVQVVPDDTGQAESVLATYLRVHTNVDTVVCTNNDVTLGAVEAKQSIGRKSVHVIDFDLSTPVLNDIQNGTVDFAIDQQQYWRGYMPMLLLTAYIRYGLVMADNFLSGPSIVDKSNVNQVIKLVAENIR